ncbi:MAG: alpha/beta hydrolase [Myxococcota bacterium]
MHPTLMMMTAMLGATPDLPTLYLDRPGGRVAYDDTGNDGPAVLCVPGMGDVRAQFRHLRPKLVAAGFRVVTMDLRGMGGSTVGWDDYSAAAVGTDVMALVEKLGLREVSLVGNSYGAAAVVYAAAEMPDQVRSVVFIGGPFVAVDPMPLWQRLMINAMLQPPWGPFAWGQYYRTLYPSSAPRDHDAHVARVVSNLREPGRMGALRAMMDAPATEWQARVPRVKARVHVVMGTRDPDFKDPTAHARKVAQLMPGEVQLVPGAGHYPHAEVVDVTAPGIIAFLRGESGRS